MFQGKQLEEINESDFADLVSNQVREMRVLEYKLALPGGTDADKKEFLADVTSLSNTSGGHIIYGLAEQNGIPTSIVGVESSNLDADILRLENLLRTSVAPRLPGVKVCPVEIGSGRHLLMVEVPRSWQMPHVVTHGGSFRFFSRNSAGKYQLDIGELRSLFDLTGRAIERVRQFRLGRIAEIVYSSGGLSIAEGAKLILHVVPVADLEHPRVSIDSQDAANGLLPIYGGAADFRINFDGVLANGHTDGEGVRHSYAQLFRSGAIEAVDTLLLSSENDGKWMIPSLTFEDALIKAVGRYLKLISSLQIQPPVAIMLTMTGVKGIQMGVTSSGFMSQFPREVDRDELLIPEMLTETLDTPTDELLRPILDAVWNAAGWPRSPYFGDDGKWRGEKK